MPSTTLRDERGNTANASLQDRGMPIASPSTISPPRLREPTARPRHAPLGHDSVTGIRPGNHVAFQQFVDANRHLFTDYVQRRLNGPHAGAAEDALQDGLIKIWKEWDRWPTEESERIRFARESMRIAALEAIRKRTGRDNSPRAGETVVDFADLDGPAPSSGPAAERLARDLGRAIAEQSLVKDQLGYLEKASLVAAIATLSDLEQRVLFMTAQGDDCKEIASDLGITHQQAREALMRARRLCRMLIEHADGQKVSEQEAKLLWQYRDGQLSGKRARELKRHIEHCTACQRLLGLEESIGTNSALVILPIPALLLAGTNVAAAGSTGPSDGAAELGTLADGTLGAQVGAEVGGTTVGTVSAPAWSGSVLAGLTAKVGVALAGLSVAGSVAGVYKLAQDRQQPPTPAALSAGALAPLAETPDALVERIAAPARTAAEETADAARKALAKKQAAKSTKPRPKRRSTQPAATPKAPAAPQPSVTALNAAAVPSNTVPAPAAATPTAAAAPRSAPSPTPGAGGEFVIGGG